MTLSFSINCPRIILILILTLIGSWSASSGRASDTKRGSLAAWERSVVTIEVALKRYDYYEPWNRRTQRVLKQGLVVGERQILTTADGLYDRTLVRLQKAGRGKWCVGEVTWIDYHANLALLTATDAEFWRDLRPVTFGGAMPSDGTLQILRWREGKLESRRAE